MAISVGDRLPEATFSEMGPEGPRQVALGEVAGQGKVVIFAVPGAYTPTCSSAHVPSLIRTKDRLAEKGVERILCVSVNDPFVLKAWGEATGATAAGIRMLADPASEFTKAIGMNFTAAPPGFFDRSRRYTMLVEDGVVKLLNVEESPGVCELSAGETLLDQM